MLPASANPTTPATAECTACGRTTLPEQVFCPGCGALTTVFRGKEEQEERKGGLAPVVAAPAQEATIGHLMGALGLGGGAAFRSLPLAERLLRGLALGLTAGSLLVAGTWGVLRLSGRSTAKVDAAAARVFAKLPPPKKGTAAASVRVETLDTTTAVVPLDRTLGVKPGRGRGEDLEAASKDAPKDPASGQRQALAARAFGDPRGLTASLDRQMGRSPSSSWAAGATLGRASASDALKESLRKADSPAQGGRNGLSSSLKTRFSRRDNLAGRRLEGSRSGSLSSFGQQRRASGTSASSGSVGADLAMGQLKFANAKSLEAEGLSEDDAAAGAASGAFEQNSGQTGTGSAGTTSSSESDPDDVASDVSSDPAACPEGYTEGESGSCIPGTNSTPYQDQLDSAQEMTLIALGMAILGLALIAAGYATSGPWGAALIVAGLALLAGALALALSAQDAGDSISSDYGQKEQGKVIEEQSNSAKDGESSSYQAELGESPDVQESVEKERKATWSAQP